MLNDPLRALLAKHRRHVEQSPGVGPDKQGYALAVLDDLERDLDALPAPTLCADDRGGFWIYRNAPLADVAALRQQPPVAREDGGET